MPSAGSRHGPFGVPDAGDFHCGRCGTLLDGGTDEPVEARDLRVEIASVLVVPGITNEEAVLQISAIVLRHKAARSLHA